MSDNSLKRRGQDDPLDRITGNPLDAAAQTIKARLATKTAEEMTKALRAKTDLYTAHSNYGQATLAHDDTAVELEQKNRTQRRENKQADLDVHAGEQKLKKMAMEEKLREAEDRKNKTPLQQDEAEFEKKRSYRLFDARDDAFESFEFEAAKDIELTKQYVKKRKEIENDPELEDEDVKKALLNKLEEQYKAQLQRAGKKQGA